MCEEAQCASQRRHAESAGRQAAVVPTVVRLAGSRASERAGCEAGRQAREAQRTG